MKPSARVARVLEAHRTTLASVVVAVLLANTFVVAHEAITPPRREALVAGPAAGGAGRVADDARPGAILPSASTTSRPSVPGRALSKDVRRAPAGSVIPGKGTVPHGIDGNELTVVYYWKGDQTKSSQFLHGSGREGNVDEGEAFRALVAWINEHAGGGELMGFRFNLHGWRLKPVVIDAGKGDDIIRAAERIASDIKPFAAVSSHGSISAYVCPRLAAAGIFNVSTYDLDWGLYERTGGYCLPQGLSWDAQVDLSVAYLRAHAAEAYDGAGAPQRRVYGLLYAEYPGLVSSAPAVARRLRAAGVPVAVVASVDPDLTTAQRQQPGVIAKFRDAGVNTIVAPEAGSLITFTHAAQAAGYTPDYYVWPCSGQDATAMVRLYSATQWARASGLSCFDEHLNADLTTDGNAPRTEWYRAYREMRPGADPPAQTPLVYQSLLPLVAGITHAGRDLTVERFTAGLRRIGPYRYDATAGRTSDPRFVLVDFGDDGSQIADAGRVRWDAARTTPGSATPGSYVYAARRSRRGATF